MSLKKALAVSAAVAMLAYSTVASATTFQLNAVVSNAYSAGFATQPLANPSPYGAGTLQPKQSYDQSKVNGATIYQIDYYVKVSGLSAGARGFGNIAWDITLPGGVTQSSDLPGWQADASNTDTNGASPGGGAALWFANADAGTAGDLKGIIQTITAVPTPTATDFRARIGQQQGTTVFTASVASCVNGTGWAGSGQDMTYLGSIYVNWNGTTPGAIQATLTGASNALAADGTLLVDPAAVLQNATVNLVPEPSTFALLGMGAVGLVSVIRRRKA